MGRKKAVTWRSPDGSPVSCVEKIKVLEQNLAEFRAVALDLLEDAVLMGCDPRMARQVLKDELDALDIRVLPAQME